MALYKTDLELYEKFVSGEYYQPLVDILTLSDIDETVIDFVLSHQEGREQLSSKIKEVYEALFIKAKNRESHTIGRLNIRPYTLEYFTMTMGILNRTSATE